MSRRFLLVDSHSLIYRSYFAFIKSPLRNERGENTSGVFGFLNTLRRLRDHYPSEYVALVFDPPGPTFRDRLFSEYKATRPPSPDDLPMQVATTKELGRFLGYRVYEVASYEADDVIASLTEQLRAHGEVLIVTSDKDLLQLVGGCVFTYDPYRDRLYDTKGVIAKTGVAPERIVEYLALVGDASDNVPGVPGIGPQRARRLLERYPDVARAFEQEEHLAIHEPVFRLSRQLVTLDRHVPIRVSPDDLLAQPIDHDRLTTRLRDLGFHSMMKEYGRAEIKPDPVRPCEQEPGVCVVALRDPGAGLFPGRTAGAPDDAGIDDQPLHDSRTIKVGIDLKEIARKHPLAPPFFDLGVAAWLIDPNRASYTFEDIATAYLGWQPGSAPGDSQRACLELYHLLHDRLTQSRQLSLYEEIEAPLIIVLAGMEERGIAVDSACLVRLAGEMCSEMARQEQQIYDHAGHRFNINSPRQLAVVLFDELRLPALKKRQVHYATDLEVLQKLAAQHPLPGAVIRFRELSKIVSTYLHPLIAHSRDGRVHTTFNQTGTATGRLSSSNPNLQSIPVRSHTGRQIRSAFVAADGYRLVSADYSQIELRILAHLSSDEALREAFRQDRDIHAHTAARVFNVAESQVDDRQRRIAKVVNFGLIYGMSEHGLAQGLDITEQQAQEFMHSYNSLYSGVDRWRKSVVQITRDRGYAETLFGRRRPIPELTAGQRQVQEYGKRLAVNSPIQGTAADIIKVAMIRLDQRLRELGFSRGLVLSIHDELLLEIEEDRTEEAIRIVREVMESAAAMDVPLRVTIGSGANWQEAHP